MSALEDSINHKGRTLQEHQVAAPFIAVLQNVLYVAWQYPSQNAISNYNLSIIAWMEYCQWSLYETQGGKIGSHQNAVNQTQCFMTLEKKSRQVQCWSSHLLSSF